MYVSFEYLLFETSWPKVGQVEVGLSLSGEQATRIVSDRQPISRFIFEFLMHPMMNANLGRKENVSYRLSLKDPAAMMKGI